MEKGKYENKPKPGNADNDDDKEKGKKKNNKKKQNDEKWAWKKVLPRNGDKEKTFGGKTYHWCKHHKTWTLHTPEEYTNNPDNRDSSESNSSEGGSNVSFASSVTQ